MFCDDVQLFFAVAFEFSSVQCNVALNFYESCKNALHNFHAISLTPILKVIFLRAICRLGSFSPLPQHKTTKMIWSMDSLYLCKGGSIVQRAVELAELEDKDPLSQRLFQ